MELKPSFANLLKCLSIYDSVLLVSSAKHIDHKYDVSKSSLFRAKLVFWKHLHLSVFPLKVDSNENRVGKETIIELQSGIAAVKGYLQIERVVFE